MLGKLYTCRKPILKGKSRNQRTRPASVQTTSSVNSEWQLRNDLGYICQIQNYRNLFKIRERLGGTHHLHIFGIREVGWGWCLCSVCDERNPSIELIKTMNSYYI